jgi:hypothetical protein
MAAFDYRQAQEVRDAFARRSVRYLFIGKSGAILLGFPDTTQDADLFLEKSASNGQAAVAALRDLGFEINDQLANDIVRGKDFVQIKSGPFDLDLVFAPTASSDLTMRGVVILRCKVFRYATSTTLSRASKRPIARRTAKACQD